MAWGGLVQDGASGYKGNLGGGPTHVQGATSVSSRAGSIPPEGVLGTDGALSPARPHGPRPPPPRLPRLWGRLWHLHQQAQDAVDGDPTKGAFTLIRALRLKSTGDWPRACLTASKDVLRLRAILAAAQGGWGRVGRSCPCSPTWVAPQPQGARGPHAQPFTLSSRCQTGPLGTWGVSRCLAFGISGAPL